ncbi:MAG: phosphotransferase [Patescibacteria group bacterium]|nr:phosphotransferase [Patescibacteria group bacterium]
MTVKTTISEKDFPVILSNYDLGEYRGFKTFANGAGQTTLLLETGKGEFVLRYYENRTDAHVDFEVELFNFLHSKNYPVPAIIKNRSGEFLSKYENKPYIIIEFIEGEHGKNPNDFFDTVQAAEVVKVVAQLHNLTKDYQPDYFSSREPYDVEYCWREFQKKHPHLVETEKGKWFKEELNKLEFPADMPKGLCHADLNYGNFLFKNGKVVAVLDFDMSFYTHVIHDVASLLYWWTSPIKDGFNERRASFIVHEYCKHHGLNESEKAHIYDALKLIILLGVSWSEEGDFEEIKKAIERLNGVGRDEFYKKIFSQNKNMKLIVLYGPPAAGKYTIAKAVAEKTGYKLFHNHLTIDLLKSVFEFGTPDFFRLSQKMRLDIFEQAAKEGIPGVIFTFVYEKPSDDGFIKQLIECVEGNGGKVFFIQIYCEKEELLKRVKEESRKQFHKVKSEEGLLKTLADGNQTSSIDFVDSKKIDSTHLSVEQTVSTVLSIIEKE